MDFLLHPPPPPGGPAPQGSVVTLFVPVRIDLRAHLDSFSFPTLWQTEERGGGGFTAGLVYIPFAQEYKSRQDRTAEFHLFSAHFQFIFC